MNLRQLNPSPAARLWLYGVGVAAGALLVAYGYLTDEQLPLWLGLLQALLNSQAAANVTGLRRHADAGVDAGRHREDDEHGERP